MSYLRNRGLGRSLVALFAFACLSATAATAAEKPQLSRQQAQEVLRVIAPDAVIATKPSTVDGLRVPQGDEKLFGLFPAIFPFEFRPIDGAGTNGLHPDWGAAQTALLRLTTVDYADGAQAPAGGDRESPRFISNAVVAQPGDLPNDAGATDFLWQWGQFLDHDLDLAPLASPAEPFDIDVPLGDPFFDPFFTGTVKIPLNRSIYDVVGGVRQQLNFITAFIDASNVYGSDDELAEELRTLVGGRLKTSAGDLLPFDPGNPGFFLAGDERSNEQVGLTSMHTLWVREHNYWADFFASTGLTDDDELLYLLARAVVGAEMQVITYKEFLPLLLGPNALKPYKGYKRNVNPGVSNVFATAAYRVGHTMLSPQILRLDADGDEIAAGHLSLIDAFFNPAEVIDHGIDPILRGLATQPAQQIDSYIVDAVRNFLFGPPGAGGFDLASLNIQRGREHGLPSYNQVRVDFGLPARTSFAQVSSDPIVQANLAAAYATVDDIDVWVGGISEDHVPGALVGETLRAILADQFQRARDGDRFWYKTYFTVLAPLLETQTLSKVIRRNTGIGAELQANAFLGAVSP
jgi:hypothetical protein